MSGRRLENSAAGKRLRQVAGGATNVDHAVDLIATRLLTATKPPPSDLETVMRRVGVVDCIADPDLMASGELHRNDAGLVIKYHPDQPRPRVNFTIAHEIGHAVLEQGGPKCPRTGIAVERICDMIASEVLMPRRLFIAHLGYRPDLDQVAHVARTFAVSLASALIRTAQLTRTTVFHLQNGRVAWGIGAVARGRHFDPGPCFRGAIQRAMHGENGKADVILDVGEGPVLATAEWRSVGPNDAYFLMRPRIRRN